MKLFIREVEGLNVSIVSNQEKFREAYLLVMQEYLNEYYTIKGKKGNNEKENN